MGTTCLRSARAGVSIAFCSLAMACQSFGGELGETAIAPTQYGVIPQFGQVSLTENADISADLADRKVDSGRYGLVIPDHIVDEDPADPAFSAVQTTVEADLEYRLEEGEEAATLILEWEQYFVQEGGADCTFFMLKDLDGQEVRFERRAAQTVLLGLAGAGDVGWSATLPLGQWVRLRLTFTARSGKAGTNDGALLVQMDHGAGLETVADVANQDMTLISGIHLMLTAGTTTSRQAAWRKLLWDATGDDVYGAAASTDSLWADRNHQIGAMEPDGAGGVRMKVWVHYNAGLYGAGELDLAARVELDEDELFLAPISETIPIVAENAYNESAIFEGLSPNTRYYVRAQLLRDGEAVAVTAPSSVRTISIPGGTPGKLHIVHGSCSTTAANKSPATTFHTGLEAAPDDATLIFSHAGDINYIDTQLRLQNAPPGPKNPNATDHLFNRQYNQSSLAEPFRTLGSYASCWFMWDDHEILNEWSGPGLGGHVEVDQELFDMAQAAAYRWCGNRQLDETSLTRRHFHIETARCLFIYLDVRAYSDHRTTMLGADQLDWVKTLLATKVKPITFFISPVTWSTSDTNTGENWSEHTAERDDLFQHFIDSNATGYLFLLSGDRHFCMHNTTDFQQWGGRVQGDWMCGVFTVGRQDYSTLGWDAGEEFEADHLEVFEAEISDHIRGYLKVDIDESDLTVRMAFTHGVTGNETYVVTTQVPHQAADLDGDGVVGSNDLLILLGAWGNCADCADCPADFNGDCIVGTLDLVILLGQWS